MTSHRFSASPAICHCLQWISTRAFGLIARIILFMIATFAVRFNTYHQVPPISLLRLVSEMWSASASTKWPTPACASCGATCELPPPSPTRQTVISASRCSLLAPRKLCRSSQLIFRTPLLDDRLINADKAVDRHGGFASFEPQEARRA